MIMVNKQNVFTNKQLNKFFNLLGDDYKPNKLIVCEKRIDIIRYLVIPTSYIQAFRGKIEGFYSYLSKTVVLFTFAQNDDGNNKQSIQLYSLHALCHEVRHHYQARIKFKGDKELDADRFATNFINNNSRKIKEIMNWRYEWEVEEED